MEAIVVFGLVNIYFAYMYLPLYSCSYLVASVMTSALFDVYVDNVQFYRKYIIQQSILSKWYNGVSSMYHHIYLKTPCTLHFSFYELQCIKCNNKTITSQLGYFTSLFCVDRHFNFKLFQSVLCWLTTSCSIILHVYKAS